MKEPSLMAVFLILACTSEGKQNVSRIDSSGARLSVGNSTGTSFVAPVAPVPITKTVRAGARNRLFACNTPLHAHDTLTITMPQPHGEYLEIVYPNGDIYFVVYPTRGERNRISLLDSKVFRSLEVIRLVIGETKGTPWIYQRDVPEALLSKPGNYRIVVGDNMESDVGSSVPKYSCEVTVRN